LLCSHSGFEIAFNEPALGPVNGRAADSHVAEPAVGGEQNLGSFDLAGVMFAPATSAVSSRRSASLSSTW